MLPMRMVMRFLPTVMLPLSNEFSMPESHGSSRWALLVGLLMLTGSSVAIAQSGSVAMPPRLRSPGSMRVVEVQPPADGAKLYTVVGAVKHSGVFLSEEKTLPLWQLIDAAGGITAQAGPSLRVIRHESVRFQVLYDPQGPKPEDTLLPGDILVVPHRAIDSENDQETTVPIACIGLIERPLVLPLDPRITTVGELVRRLIQSPELARTARIIDPYGEQGTTLKSGSIVLFHKHLVDRAPLQQPGAALPPVIDLKKSAIQQSAMTPTAEALAPVDILSASNQQPAEVLPPPTPPMLVASTSTPVPAISREKTAFPALPMVRESPAWDAEQAISEPTLPPAAPLPVPNDDALTSIDAKPIPEEFAEAVPLSEILEQSETVSAPPPAKAKPVAAKPVPTETAEPAPLPPIENRISTAKPALMEMADTRKAITEKEPPHGTVPASSIFILALTFAILAGTAIGISVPHLRRVWGAPEVSPMAAAVEKAVAAIPPAPEVPRTPEISSIPEVSSTPEALPPPKPAVQPSNLAALQTVLNRSAPLIEERIEIPSRWPLHGKVIGHQRIILNTVHETPPAPHFAISEKGALRKSQTPAASARERELRQALRDHIRQQSTHGPELGLAEPDSAAKTADSEMTPSRPAAVQSAPAPSDSRQTNLPPAPHAAQFQTNRNSTFMTDDEQPFDIVLPPPPAPKFASSPLERALRTLASEKRG
jgi:hypothetical protein